MEMTDYPTYSATEDRTMPAVAYGLYFGGFATAGLTTGVFGESTSTNGTGVYGFGSASSGKLMG